MQPVWLALFSGIQALGYTVRSGEGHREGQLAEGTGRAKAKRHDGRGARWQQRGAPPGHRRLGEAGTQRGETREDTGRLEGKGGRGAARSGAGLSTSSALGMSLYPGSRFSFRGGCEGAGGCRVPTSLVLAARPPQGDMPAGTGAWIRPGSLGGLSWGRATPPSFPREPVAGPPAGSPGDHAERDGHSLPLTETLARSEGTNGEDVALPVTHLLCDLGPEAPCSLPQFLTCEVAMASAGPQAGLRDSGSIELSETVPIGVGTGSLAEVAPGVGTWPQASGPGPPVVPGRPRVHGEEGDIEAQRAHGVREGERGRGLGSPGGGVTGGLSPGRGSRGQRAGGHGGAGRDHGGPGHQACPVVVEATVWQSGVIRGTQPGLRLGLGGLAPVQ